MSLSNEIIERSQTDLNHVEIYRTKKFSFKPSGLQTGASAFNLHSSRVPIDNTSDAGRSSIWNCDGEVVHDADVSVRYIRLNFFSK